MLRYAQRWHAQFNASRILLPVSCEGSKFPSNDLPGLCSTKGKDVLRMLRIMFSCHRVAIFRPLGYSKLLRSDGSRHKTSKLRTGS